MLRSRSIAVGLLLSLKVVSASADDVTSQPLINSDENYRWSVHGQAVQFVQGYPRFPALYDGQNSLPSYGEARFTSMNNLFVGVKLWEGAEVFANPALQSGYGIGGTSNGAAGYPNGIVGQGASTPYVELQRLYFKQTINLGGDYVYDPKTGARSQVLASTENQLRGKVSKDRIVFTVGKFNVGDIFNDNIYAHDPTQGFINLSFNSIGSFNYAQDQWGYTWGAAAEFKKGNNIFRAGVFELPQYPGAMNFDRQIFNQWGAVMEFEHRYEILGQRGSLKLLAYENWGKYAVLDQLLAYENFNGNSPPAQSDLRTRTNKMGVGFNWQQQIIPNLGMFVRAGMSDGRIETIANTDIDRSWAMGFVAAGQAWNRPFDEFGIAGSINAINGPQIRFLSAGGTGLNIGDGALNYGPEKDLEAYYKLGFNKNLDVTFDYQRLMNPGYNKDRGPVNVFGIRLNAHF